MNREKFNIDNVSNTMFTKQQKRKPSGFGLTYPVQIPSYEEVPPNLGIGPQLVGSSRFSNGGW